ncbi:MAG: glucosaminidase [Gammaproteobacteria bacterium]|nr:glucosaminidase [Gammaproteobacteria bacterium]MCP4090722.1 glucosaminidase [Gammaproteobacteria bacterium]MCP4277149.1 glucosaminidase [Gammaproteobacteria bacterium]
MSMLILQSCSNSTELDEHIIAATGGETNPKVVTLSNYKQVLKLFHDFNYTTETWQAGIREVPRIYLSEITSQWGEVTTKEINVSLKKKLFFRVIGPLTLRSNELILQDRSHIEAIKQNKGTPKTKEQAWLAELANNYGLKPAEYKDNIKLIEELLLRVDIVPPSLVLAQAAEESGWGTSRFAFKGNALFGQWTWGKKGIRPSNQRDGKGDYKIAVFDAPLQSVQAHAKNLNSHHAYNDFRTERARLRRTGTRISGDVLAGTLSSYSERGEDYVKSLRSIMSYNKLDPVDDAYLGKNQAIVLVDPDI